MTLNALEGQPADLRPEEGLENFVQFVGTDDRDDELQEAPPRLPRAAAGTGAGSEEVSDSTRIAPSPWP